MVESRCSAVASSKGTVQSQHNLLLLLLPLLLFCLKIFSNVSLIVIVYRELGGSVGSPTEMYRAHREQQLGAESWQNVHPIVGSCVFKTVIRWANSFPQPMRLTECTFADPLAIGVQHTFHNKRLQWRGWSQTKTWY